MNEKTLADVCDLARIMAEYDVTTLEAIAGVLRTRVACCDQIVGKFQARWYSEDPWTPTPAGLGRDIRECLDQQTSDRALLAEAGFKGTLSGTLDSGRVVMPDGSYYDTRRMWLGEGDERTERVTYFTAYTRKGRRSNSDAAEALRKRLNELAASPGRRWHWSPE